VDVLHISLSYIISINVNSLPPERNNSICALSYQFEFCARSHFFSYLITPKPFSMDGLFEGSKEARNVWEHDMGCMAGGGRPALVNFVITAFVFKIVCGPALSC